MIIRRRPARVLLVLVIGLAAGAAVFVVWARAELHASLPALDGSLPVAGLTAPVTIDRDALGIPLVSGRSREDVARATGFLHAQDRFFQMDLTRRRAAGELSELVGARALEVDTEIRVHRFRAVARRALTLMDANSRALIDAYTAGVNQGLASLESAPFEYLLLRQDPARWRAEDSLLVVLSMFITLQDSDGSYESALGTMRDILPPPMYDFVVAPGTEWDAPIVGERFSVAPVPGPEVYNLRARRAGKTTPDVAPAPLDRVQQRPTTPRTLLAAIFGGAEPWDLEGPAAGAEAIGSNNWAVSGRLTADGTPLLANDMHLSVRVPNIWYRASIAWADPNAEPHRVTGVTLPGFPSIVAGSNTHVAWGFTNTYADWADVVLLDVDPADPTRYRTPEGWRQFERHDEVIAVAGEDERHQVVDWTIWGPVMDPDYRGRPRAYKWVAHSAERLATAGAPLETARSVQQAFEEANGLGTPGQNLVAVDRDGRIGWSIYGSIPRREGLDGQLPSSWADGARGWRGWLTDAEYPRIVDPPDGRIWTANARVVDGEMLEKLGDGSYEVGSRATVIRDRLFAKERFETSDMLAIQLDANALFLARWRQLILKTLTPAAVRDRGRAAFRGLVDRSWTGEASPAAVGYRLTRMFREQVSERVIAFLLAECFEADPAFMYTTLRRREGPIWKLLTERPAHLLDPRYDSWDALLLDAIDDVIARAEREGDLNGRVWSEYNVTAYRHPLSGSLPWVARWLDMPRHPVPGDLFTPRVHWGNIAASERMVVSPGREREGIMHMPTGQSGHPLSPFYGNSHDAWVRGDATPFLPGPGVHHLTLTP